MQALAGVVDERAARGAKPALASGSVDQAALEQRRDVVAADIARIGKARLTALFAVLFGLQLERVDADQLLTREAAEIEIGLVGVDDAIRGVLQRRRERRLPEHSHELGDTGIGANRTPVRAEPVEALHACALVCRGQLTPAAPPPSMRAAQRG